MSFTLACGDVLPGCPATFTAPDRETLLGQVREHARVEHGMTDITPDVAETVAQHVRQQ